MTDFEIRTATGKERTVATLKADTKAADSVLATRLLEDECRTRGLDPTEHVIRGWDPRRGWITYGGSR